MNPPKVVPECKVRILSKHCQCGPKKTSTKGLVIIMVIAMTFINIFMKFWICHVLVTAYFYHVLVRVVSLDYVYLILCLLCKGAILGAFLATWTKTVSKKMLASLNYLLKQWLSSIYSTVLSSSKIINQRVQVMK